MISKSDIKDIYPLSPMQEGMLFHALENPASSAYFEQISYRVSGSLNMALFSKTWDYLFQRHDILRTAFLHERTKRPLQVVLKQRAMPVEENDFRGLDEQTQDDIIAAYRDEEKQRGFDLRADPLLRARVIKLRANSFEVILSFHHILMDGWCMGILNAEFLQVYECLRTGGTPWLPPPPPYQRYIDWLERQDRGAALDYWAARLADFDAPSFLPGRKPHAGFRLEQRHNALDSDISARLRDTAAAWGVTVNALLQAAWALVLGRYADSDDVLFGTVVSGRPADIPDVDRILGLFINLLPVRAKLHDAEDCRALARSLHAALLEALPHSYCSIGEVAARTKWRQGLLDHILVFENYPASRASTAGPLEVTVTDRFEQTNYDFVIVIAPGVSIDVEFHFNAEAFDAKFVGCLQANFIHALKTLPSNSLVRDFDALCEAEAPRAGREVNLPDTTPISMFEEQAARTPDAIAIDDCGVGWSYAELNARAGHLAAILLDDYRLAPEDRVAVLIPRSRWLPLALLGALKAGAVYLPIDPETPPDRIRFFLEDSRARVLLTAGPLEGSWPAPVLDISALPSRSGFRAGHPDQLAWAIYTSGSTGVPKAVGISNRAAINLVQWHRREFALDERSRATMFASPGFDASLWEMLPYLLSGGCIVPVPDDDRTDAERLLRFFTEHGITHAFVPPAVCEEIGRVNGGRLDRMRILTGGDVLRSAAGFSGNLYNNYGPTESAVVATSIRVDQGDDHIPIGRPIDNTEILALDSRGRPTPAGVPGELHIASASLARGYLGRPGLTAEKFQPHPSCPGARMYLTGDLGHWKDGTIHFVGRSDRQVKVNGVRIEPGEIEAVLEQHPHITEAAVEIRSGQRIVAWVVAPEAALDGNELRHFVAVRLPAAMLPSRFVILPSMPRTRNGKTDRTALTETEASAQRRRAPTTPEQHELAAIWGEVLNVADIALDDDFFALGGHSLTVTRAMSRIRDRLNVDLPLRAIFEAPTIARLAEVIAALRSAAGPTVSEPQLVARPRVALKRAQGRD